MRVFELNDYDAYCGRTLLQAVRAAMKDSGERWDKIVDRDHLCEVPVSEWSKKELRDETDDGKTKLTTLAAVMATVTTPQCVYSSEC